MGHPRQGRLLKVARPYFPQPLSRQPLRLGDPSGRQLGAARCGGRVKVFHLGLALKINKEGRSRPRESTIVARDP